MTVYDFDCGDDIYPTTVDVAGSNRVPPAARWVEGYAATSSSEVVPHDSGLKIRLSNRQIVRLVNIN